MKLTFTFLLLLTLKITYAKCALPRISVWPVGDSITLIQTFILEGFGKYQSVIDELGSKYRIYLKSSTGNIDLRIDTIYIGDYKTRQALLKPVHKLTHEQSYELVVENMPDGCKIYKANNTGWKGSLSWIVYYPYKPLQPSWLKLPNEISKAYKLTGEGYQIYVQFRFLIRCNTEYYLRTTVTSLSSGSVRTYCLLPYDNMVALGTNPCSGEFEFTPGYKYKVDFTIVDINGKITKAKESINFTSPEKNE